MTVKHTIVKMTEIDYCVICGKPVDLETDPSVCSEKCFYWLEVEWAFNKVAKQDCENYNSRR